MSLINWTVVMSLVTAWLICQMIDFASDIGARVIGKILNKLNI